VAVALPAAGDVLIWGRATAWSRQGHMAANGWCRRAS